MRFRSITTLFILSIFGLTMGVYYIPQRTDITYFNEKYAYNASASITRYGRKSTYYYNLKAGIYHTWGNNITLHLVFYEGQQNQFKRSFFEIHLKLCDLLQRDPNFGKAIGMIMARFGITCPTPPGMYRFFNMTVPSEHIPNLLPFQKGKIEATFRQLPTNDIIATLYAIFIVKDKQIGNSV